MRQAGNEQAAQATLTCGLLKLRSQSSVRLLVYYGAAVAYNTPWYGVNTRIFSDVAKEAARIAANQSAFERIYPLIAWEPELEAYEVFPVFATCK